MRMEFLRMRFYFWGSNFYHGLGFFLRNPQKTSKFPLELTFWSLVMQSEGHSWEDNMGTKILNFLLKSVRYPVLPGDSECIDIDGRTPISGTVSRRRLRFWVCARLEEMRGATQIFFRFLGCGSLHLYKFVTLATVLVESWDSNHGFVIKNGYNFSCLEHSGAFITCVNSNFVVYGWPLTKIWSNVAKLELR